MKRSRRLLTLSLLEDVQRSESPLVVQQQLLVGAIKAVNDGHLFVHWVQIIQPPVLDCHASWLGDGIVQAIQDLSPVAPVQVDRLNLSRWQNKCGIPLYCPTSNTQLQPTFAGCLLVEK